MSMAFFRRTKSNCDQERYELIREIQEIKNRLQIAQQEFESVSAPELIEASVYEIKSLQARYAYYIRIAKSEEATLSGGHVFRQKLKATTE